MITGSTICAIRRVRNISQLELARRAGIIQPYLSDMEKGHRFIKPDQEAAILEALSVSPEQAEEVTALVRSIDEVIANG